MHDDGLVAFERTHLEKLRLACQVILDMAAESFVSDALEAELHILRDRVEVALLLPDHPDRLL